MCSSRGGIEGCFHPEGRGPVSNGERGLVSKGEGTCVRPERGFPAMWGLLRLSSPQLTFNR